LHYSPPRVQKRSHEDDSSGSRFRARILCRGCGGGENVNNNGAFAPGAFIHYINSQCRSCRSFRPGQFRIWKRRTKERGWSLRNHLLAVLISNLGTKVLHWADHALHGPDFGHFTASHDPVFFVGLITSFSQRNHA
jgi:hypothetical protein